jgi:hypothetical protein
MYVGGTARARYSDRRLCDAVVREAASRRAAPSDVIRQLIGRTILRGEYSAPVSVIIIMHERLLRTHDWPRGCQVYRNGLSHLFQSRTLEEASDSSRHRKNCRSDVQSVLPSGKEDGPVGVRMFQSPLS